MELLLLSLPFAVLLWLEWRRRSRLARAAAVLMAIALYWFSGSSPRAAARYALTLPVAERVTSLSGRPISEFESGVLTMEDAVVSLAKGREPFRLLSVGVLLWLSLSPVFRATAPRVASVEGVTPAPAPPVS